MDTFQEIDIHEAKKLIDLGNVTVVDFRDPLAYQTSHISQAISIDDSNVEKFLEGTDRKKPLICYCYHGFSSQSAAHFFKQNGFKEVYSIIGGYEEFKKSYPAF